MWLTSLLSIYAIPVKEIWPKGIKDVNEFRQIGSGKGNIYRIGLVREIFAVKKRNIPVGALASTY